MVDDDLALQDLIVNILRKAGFAASGVASGAEALAAAAANPPCSSCWTNAWST